MRVERLVFVCSGNICRSPYGHARAAAKGLAAASCGTTAIDGARADSSAIRIAGVRGVNLDSHASSRVTSIEFGARDLLIAMEPHHVRVIEPLARRNGAQLTLLGLWSDSPSSVIPDPYGGSDECFEFVFGMIDQALGRLTSGMSLAQRPQ